MVVRLASLVILGLMAGTAVARPLLVEDAQIATLRSDGKAASALLKKCAREQAEPVHAVADLNPEPHYTQTGANPDGGMVKGFTSDVRRAYRLGLCFRLNGDAATAKAVQAIADGWAGTLRAASTPQGRSDINFNLAQLIVAASWVEGVGGWNDGLFKQWVSGVIAPMSLAGEPNNRGNWGVLLEAAIAAFNDDKPALKRVSARWQALVDSEIAADGTLPREICRSNSANHCDGPDKGVNGLAYTHYALLPATLSATLLREAGAPVLADKTLGAKFASAYAKTLGFTLQPESFPFYASNGGKISKVDTCNYFPLLRFELAKAGLGPIPQAREISCGGDYWLLKTLFAN